MGGGAHRFGVLGPLVYEREAGAVALRSGRQRSLLALLLLAGGAPLSRDRLIDELWGERPPGSAVSALHVHLSKLRGLVGGLLVLEPAGYALRAGGYELDVDRFDALVEEARGDPARAVALLEEALGLFRGEPLADVACERSVAQWRRTLEEKRLQAILMRFDAELAAGASGELVAELERLAAEHPYEERIWGQLMLALYRGGRQADALDAYQRARRLFAEELGLEPGEQLARLQAQILERDPALRPPAAAPTPVPAAPSPRVASSVPRPLTRLFGRERELETLTELLADSHVRIVTLTGPGGVGKTRLMLELATRLEPDYPDGVVFVRLEQLTDASLVAAEIASALAQNDPAEAPSADALTAYLRERELLILIDNFEHLLAAAVVVAELLEMAPRLHLLVSSRTPLRIRGEQLFEVEPLPLPAGESEAELAQSPAVQLFLQTARAANRRLEIDVEMMRTIAGVCRALDGLPLAIELAASRSLALEPAQIAAQLAQPLAIGENALRDLPQRQRTLQATIRWSYDLLEPAAQEVLRSAAVFFGGFTLSALEAVAGAPAQAQLDELLEASLVRRRADDSRFELLALVRAFGLAELERHGESSEGSARHRRHYASLVAEASRAFDEGEPPGDVAAPLLADHANLRAALEDAIETSDEASAVALALGLRPLWFAGMLRQECWELVERVIERLEVPGTTEVALLRAAVFFEVFRTPQGWKRRLAAAAARIGDQDSMAMAIGNLFAESLNTRDLESMRELRPELLALAESGASDRAVGWINYFLTLDAYVEGELDAACEHADAGVEKARSAGHEYLLASAMGAQLLAHSARDGEIRQPDLAATLEHMRRPGLLPMIAFALWFVARYAAAVAPDAAGRWLAHGERILLSIEHEIWPESELRDETLAVLGLADLTPLLESTPPLEPAAAIAEAIDWLAARDASESAPRVVPAPLTPP